MPWVEGTPPTPVTIDPEEWAVGLGTLVRELRGGFAFAPAISGWTYYRDTAPHLSARGLATVKALITSL